MQKPRYPKNVAGDFYVAENCCISCGIWEGRAEHLIRWDEAASGTPQCYVYRQPQGRADIDALLAVMDIAEVDCFRYAGENAEILRKLVNSDHAGNCDSDAALQMRPQIWFALRFRPRPTATPEDYAAGLCAYFQQCEDAEREAGAPRRFQKLESHGASVTYAFSDDAVQMMTVSKASGDGYVEIAFTPPLAATRSIRTMWVSDWLETIGAERLWLTADDIAAGRPGSAEYY